MTLSRGTRLIHCPMIVGNFASLAVNVGGRKSDTRAIGKETPHAAPNVLFTLGCPT